MRPESLDNPVHVLDLAQEHSYATRSQYRHHKARNVAVVTIEGKDHYLGTYNSTESHQRYHRLLLDKLQAPPTPSLPVTCIRDESRTPNLEQVHTSLSINELILRYWKFASQYYLKNGQPTSELDCIRHALGFLRRKCGSMEATLLGPKSLKSVRESMLAHPITRKRRHPQTGSVHLEIIATGLTRKVINKHIGRIRRMFRWAVEEELLPAIVQQALLSLGGLRRGRSTARECPRVRPVSELSIQAVLPFLQPMMATIIQIHWLCGCRSQDILALRSADIDRRQPVWEYRPAHYKTEHLNDEDNPDLDRIIFLGPKAQALLQPWLLDEKQEYVFSPRRAEQIRNQQRHATRKTKFWPSHQRRNHSKRLEHSRIRSCYDDNTYRRAVQRACEKAGIPPWAPNQLRHTRLTEIRRIHGLEAAKACAGHREIGVTQHYAEQDQQLARKVMLEQG